MTNDSTYIPPNTSVQFITGPLTGFAGKIVAREPEGYHVRLDDERLVKKVQRDHLKIIMETINVTGDDLTKIVDRIRKLRNKSESARSIGSEAEAQSFADAVQKMLLKYKLEMSDVDVAAQEKEDKMTQDWVQPGQGNDIQKKKVRSAWLEHLASAVARAHFCRIMIVPGSNTIYFVGRESDVAVAKYVYISLGAAAYKIADKAYGEYYRKMYQAGDREAAKGYRAAFLVGYSDRIAERYREEERQYLTGAMKQIQADAEKAGVPREHALVKAQTALQRVKDARSAVDQFMAGMRSGKASYVRGKSSSHSAGYSDGQAAGSRANIRSTGLGGGSGAGPKRLGGGK